MICPDDIKYTKQHEWIKISDQIATIGITSYAVEQLGHVVYLDLPKIGSVFNEKEAFGTIESTKTVSDLYTPVKCKVIETNQELLETPELLLQDAYTKGWLIKVEILNMPSDVLLSAQEYKEYVKDILL